MQYPVAVFTPTHRAGARELSERCRDRWPVRSDKVSEPLVRERKRNDDALRMHSPPTLGEVPKREYQAIVNALVIGDRQRDSKRVRTPSAAVEQLNTELRPRRNAADEPLIEHGHASRLEHRPADLSVHMRPLPVPRPWTHYIAVAQQLDALASEHLDVPREEAVDDQESAVMTPGLHGIGGIPIAWPQPQQLRPRLVSGAVELSRLDQLAEVWIGLNDGDRRRRGLVHLKLCTRYARRRSHADTGRL